MQNVLIIDDESKARFTLAHMLRTYCPEINNIDEASTAEEAMQAIRTKLPTIVFLDIALKDTTGFDLLDDLGKQAFKLIFVTAYDEFAIKAFKYSAVDYLLKPVNPDELINAVTKSIDLVDQFQKMSALNHNLKSENGRKLILKTSTEIFLINSKDIIQLEADGNYTVFHLKDKRKIVVSVTLKEYEEILSGLNFFRPHQSHLVNIEFFEKLDKRHNVIVMADKRRIPVSTRKKEELNIFLNAINRY
jgi:two-component system, LytTR family, response regulator